MFLARFTEAASFLILPGIFKKKIKIYLLRIVFLSVVLAVIILISIPGFLPVFYTEGTGVTNVKISGDYFICLTLLAAILYMIKNDNCLEPVLHSAIVIALLLSIFSQFLLALDPELYGVTDLIGYGLKPLAFFSIYSGIFEFGIAKPLLKLKESEVLSNIEKYKIENLLDSINCGLFHLDPQSGEIVFSGNWFQSLGYSENETPLSLEAWEELIHPDDRFCAGIVANAGEGELIDLEYRIKRKSGEYEFVNIKALYILMDFSEIKESIFGINIIISDRKKFEEELIVEKSKALKLEEFKTVLIDNLSHEIRTPMNSISGFSRLLIEQEFSKSRRNKYLSIIVNSANHITSLLSDLNDLSNIEGKNFLFDITDVNLNELIDEIEAIYLHRLSVLKKDNIALTTEKGCDDKFTIQADRSRLKQVLFNLLNNSVKFTVIGEICITYHVADERINFSVSDTGIGIDDSKRDIIFDRFRQGGEGSSRNFSGIGIGLAITRQLVEKMGGSIGFVSETGSGSKFYFDIPVNQQLLESI